MWVWVITRHTGLDHHDRGKVSLRQPASNMENTPWKTGENGLEGTGWRSGENTGKETPVFTWSVPGS